MIRPKRTRHRRRHAGRRPQSEASIRLTRVSLRAELGRVLRQAVPLGSWIGETRRPEFLMMSLYLILKNWIDDTRARTGAPIFADSETDYGDRGVPHRLCGIVIDYAGAEAVLALPVQFGRRLVHINGKAHGLAVGTAGERIVDTLVEAASIYLSGAPGLEVSA